MACFRFGVGLGGACPFPLDFDPEKIDPVTGALEAPKLKVEVRDTGIGIAQDRVGLLFNSLQQADEQMRDLAALVRDPEKQNEARRIVHSLKSSSAMAGAGEASTLAAKIERAIADRF